MEQPGTPFTCSFEYWAYFYEIHIYSSLAKDVPVYFKGFFSFFENARFPFLYHKRAHKIGANIFVP